MKVVFMQWSRPILATLSLLFVASCDSGDGVNASCNPITDSRDGQSYCTVTIGSQTWMAENLNYQIAGSYCYDDNPMNCTKYGRLYEYDAAEKSCPAGWHLPSKDEWWTLFDFVNKTYPDSAVYALWAKGFRNWPKAFDAFGFSVVPAGNLGDHCGNVMSQHGGGEYCWLEESAFFQIREPSCNSFCHLVCMSDSCEGTFLPNNGHVVGEALSVRCLKGDLSENAKNSTDANANVSSSSKGELSSSSSMIFEYGTMTDSRDGKIYKTVKIEKQIWMAENLKFESNNASEFYSWAVAMDSAGVFSTNGKDCGYNTTCSPTNLVRGICPEGWRLPTGLELSSLGYFLSARHDIELYRKLGIKATIDSMCQGYDFTTNDLKCLNTYYLIGTDVVFWSADEISSSAARCGTLSFPEVMDKCAHPIDVSKLAKNQIRCVQDTATYTKQSSSSVTHLSSSSKTEISNPQSSSFANAISSDSKPVSSSSFLLSSSSSKNSVVAVYIEKAYVCMEVDSDKASKLLDLEGTQILDKCPKGGETCDLEDTSIVTYIYPGAVLDCAALQNSIAEK